MSIIAYYLLNFVITIFFMLILSAFLKIDYHVLALLYTSGISAIAIYFLATLILCFFLKKIPGFFKITLPNIIGISFYIFFIIINWGKVNLNEIDVIIVITLILPIVILYGLSRIFKIT